MKEMAFENYEVQEDENQPENHEYLNELLKKHKEIENKKSFTREDRALKHEIKSILFVEIGMTPLEMAEFLDLDRSTISYWLSKYHPEEVKMKSTKHSYPTTERERRLMNRFMNKFLQEIDEERNQSINYNLKGIRSKFDKL